MSNLIATGISSSATSLPTNAPQTCLDNMPSGLDTLHNHYVCGITRGNAKPNFKACCLDDMVYDGSEYVNPRIAGCISYCKADKTLSDFEDCIYERAGYNRTEIGVESFFCDGSLDKNYNNDDNSKDNNSNSSSRIKPIGTKSNIKVLVTVALISFALLFSSTNV